MKTSRRNFLRGLSKAPFAVPALAMVKLPEAKEPEPINCIEMVVSAMDFQEGDIFVSNTFEPL